MIVTRLICVNLILLHIFSHWMFLFVFPVLVLITAVIMSLNMSLHSIVRFHTAAVFV